MERESRDICRAQKAPQRTSTPVRALAWTGVLLMLLILGAHYFRAGNSLAVMSVGGIILFHASGGAWKTCVVGIALAWGVLEWGMTLQTLVMIRMHMGAPWGRGAAILGVIAAMTALAASRSLAKAIWRRRETPGDSAFTQTAAFIVTFLSLYALRSAKPGLLLLECFFPAWGAIQVFLLAWYAGYIAGKLNNPRASRKTRKTVWFLFTLVFFGQLTLGLSGALGTMPPGTLHIPVPAFILFAPAYRGTVGMMPFLVVTATLLAGSAWCGMLCYFGSIEAVAASRKPVRNASPLLHAAIRYGRGVILLLGLAVALMLRHLGASVETALILAGFFAVGSLVVMMFVSRSQTGMVHCTALCPLGLVVNLLSRLSLWRIRIDRERCQGCGACEKVCGYRALDGGARKRGQAAVTCSLCRDCIGTCPHKALSLKNFLLPTSVSGNVFTVIVAALHTIFLAAARPF